MNTYIEEKIKEYNQIGDTEWGWDEEVRQEWIKQLIKDTIQYCEENTRLEKDEYIRSLQETIMFMLVQVGGEITLTDITLVSTNPRRMVIETADKIGTGEKVIRVREMTEEELSGCSCGEYPHRISCPKGFNKYFEDKYKVMKGEE